MTVLDPRPEPLTGDVTDAPIGGTPRRRALRAAGMVMVALAIVAAGAAGTFFLVLDDRDTGGPGGASATAAGADATTGEQDSSDTTTGEQDSSDTTTGEQDSSDTTTGEQDSSDTTTGEQDSSDTTGSADETETSGATDAQGTAADESSEGSVSGPGAAVRRHFETISAGDYTGAWEMFSSRYQARVDREGWISDAEANRSAITVESAYVKRYLGGGRALVFLDIVTHDSGQPGCKRFTGKVATVQEGGTWRYDSRRDFGTTFRERDAVSADDPRCAALR